MKNSVWSISEKKSAIHFKMKYLQVGLVSGVFLKFSGVIKTGKNFINPEISILIDSSSVETNSEERNSKLISSEYLNAEKYPYLGFISHHGSCLSSGKIWELNGDLVVKLVTTPITLIVKSIVVRDRLKTPVAIVSLFGNVQKELLGIEKLNSEDIGSEIQIFANLQLKKQPSNYTM